MYVRSEACYFSETLRLYYFIVVFSLSHNVDIRKEKNSYINKILIPIISFLLTIAMVMMI